MTHVSGIDDACGRDISAHHMLLSNCVVQVMRVWSLPAALSPPSLAKLHIRYGATQPTAYRILHQLLAACWGGDLGAAGSERTTRRRMHPGRPDLTGNLKPEFGSAHCSSTGLPS